MAVDGDDEVRPRREVPVDGADAYACRCGDVTHGHVDTGADEGRGGRGDQGLLVAPGVGPFPRRPRSARTVGHRSDTSPTRLAKRNSVPYGRFRNIVRLD